MQHLLKYKKLKAAGNRTLVLLLFFLSLVGCTTSDEKAVDYIKELSQYSIRQEHFKKYLVDPSYNYPYNVYIKLEMDSTSSSKLVKDLKLETQFGSDSADLKRYTPLDEYSYFFSMHSINSERNSSVGEAEQKMAWWSVGKKELSKGQVYASPFKDSISQKGVVSFKDRYNGRLALIVDKLDVYILIESWGW